MIIRYMRYSLDSIVKKYKSFIKPEHVYKICRGKDTNKWIVIMKKLPDTITNEDRKNVYNRHYAKFRANKLRVIKIINIFSLKSVKKITHNPICSGVETIYQKNYIVLPDKYDESEKVCTHGIHYYKSISAAYYYDNPEDDYVGKWIESYDDGFHITYFVNKSYN